MRARTTRSSSLVFRRRRLRGAVGKSEATLGVSGISARLWMNVSFLQCSPTAKVHNMMIPFKACQKSLTTKNAAMK